MDVATNEITAFIGPSGCGKTTMLRSFNRMNDLIPTAKITGDLKYRGVDLYDKAVDPVEVSRRIGMVFQNQIPFQSQYMTTWHTVPKSLAKSTKAQRWMTS